MVVKQDTKKKHIERHLNKAVSGDCQAVMKMIKISV